MISRGWRALLPCALLAAGLTHAQVPAGPAFVVSPRRAFTPQVVARANGEFIVVWNPIGDDIFARRFAPDGTPRSAEFRVNASTTAVQSGGSLGLDARGGGVVTWTETRDTVDLFARRLAPGGTAIGADFQVNSFPNMAGAMVAMAPGGQFMVVWPDLDFPQRIFGRRFDAFARPLGADFFVNVSYNRAGHVRAASDARGDVTVVWQNYLNVPGFSGTFGQRFDPAGNRVGGEFRVNTHTTDVQMGAAIGMAPDGTAVIAFSGPAVPGALPQSWARRFTPQGEALGEELAVSAPRTDVYAGREAVALDEAGNFAVSWTYQGTTNDLTVTLRRFASDGTPRGDEVTVGTSTLGPFVAEPTLASDAVGNLVVAWPDGSSVLARRYGGMFPAGLGVGGEDDGVLEVADHFTLATAWRNSTGAAQTLQGRSSRRDAPAGLTFTLSAASDYGTVASGAVGACTSPCFTGTLEGTRPAGHVDLSFFETLLPDEQGQAKRWLLHLGDSFADVPRAGTFYRFVETLVHTGVAAGCTSTTFCPTAPTTRAQMAAFVLAAKDGPGPPPPDCGTPLFSDVPASSAFCRYVEEMARRGISAGCGDGRFCPGDPVSREQMAVFLLRTLDPALSPPSCTMPVFADVPASSPFCRWVEELARRGLTAGCGGGNYCPALAVTREQMAAFVTATFGLTLYGP